MARRATEQEKQRARDLRAKGLTYRQISKICNRSNSVILAWCDPDALEKHRARVKKWDDANAEAKKAKDRAYFQTPRGKAILAARVADRERWEGAAFASMGVEDKAKTIEIYSERDRLNAIHGAGAYHVDHIQPYMEGGEHIWWNLQLLTAAENLSKGSKFRAEDQALYTQRIVELFNNEG